MRENLDENHPSLFDSLIEKEREALKQEEVGAAESPESKLYKSKGQKYWKKFDEGVLKPFLIFNYVQRKDEIKKMKKKQRLDEIHVKYESEGELKYSNNVLDPNNEEKNVFVEVKKEGESNGHQSDKEESDSMKRRSEKQALMKEKIAKARRQRGKEE